jgi:hypothetical protein
MVSGGWSLAVIIVSGGWQLAVDGLEQQEVGCIT